MEPAPSTPPVDLSDATALLKKHWGHDGFKPAQAESLAYILQGFDVLTVLSTGYGKSAIFQVAALLLQGTAVVVSPLIALMKDQADDCLKRGIPASYVNSTLTEEDSAARLEALANGEYSVFYIAPERIGTRAFKEALDSTSVSLVVVDEAHCVSRLGHDFRPAYLRIHELVTMSQIGEARPPIIAFTATATKEIETDIAKGCGMGPDYKRIVGDPIRPNLNYLVWAGSMWKQIGHAADGFDPAKGRYVVYCGTRKGAEKVAEIIQEHCTGTIEPGQIEFYHAGLDKNERNAVQDRFKAGKTVVVVATCAFGMGIDVPNIRAVVHCGIPGCVEDYVQESGRGGRDGLPTDVILICDGENDYSVQMQKRFIDNMNPPYEIYELLWDWLHETLGPAQILSMSGEDIAKSILEKPPTGRRSPVVMRPGVEPDKYALSSLGQQVLGCLSTMDAYGLVTRHHSEAGTVLACNVKACQEVWEGSSGGVKTVLDVLNAHIKEFFLSEEAWMSTDHKKTVEISIDRAEFAAEVGLSLTALLNVLKKLVTADVLEMNKTFKGKTTQIRRYGAKLADHLPREMIDDKRRRAYERLDSMIGYLRARDRKTYIRDYFLNG